MTEKSIFERYYSPEPFVDRLVERGEGGLDVIIPIKDTNELWESNLLSIYREIPVNRLLIGDGGCTDGSLGIARRFPRVEVIDQSSYKTLGYCIRKLIERVETEWFIYLHSDVYLPEAWYDRMKAEKGKYDWYECRRRLTVLIDYPLEAQNQAERAYSGSQMGRRGAFDKVLPKIEDDYLYRNEDIVLSELVKAEGFRYGRVMETYHYHQSMTRRGEKDSGLANVVIERQLDLKRERHTYDIQWRGLVKYLQPSPYLIQAATKTIRKLRELDAFDGKEFETWVKKTNPAWLKPLAKEQKKIWRSVVKRFISALIGFRRAR